MMVVRNVLAAVGFIGIAGVAAVALTAHGGVFGDRMSPPRLNVSFRGLDLTTPEGLDLLNRRIGFAVDEVCATDQSRGLANKRPEYICRENA